MVETAQADPNALISIGTVAAMNIASAIGQPLQVALIEKSIKDEITAMSSHFTMAMADVQTAYEIEVAKIKSTFSFVKGNKQIVIGALGTAMLAGFMAGLFA